MSNTWKIMPCPEHGGKHHFHDHRWIATADVEVERGHDPRSWGLSKGSLICEMRDGPPYNARLIAAAPELLEVVRGLVERADLGEVDLEEEDKALIDRGRELLAEIED